MKILQVLQKLGLTDKEPEIYLELIKTSGVQPASIIAQKVGMNRTTVYKTLLKLAKMGLITKTMKHGITCFLAEEPEKSLEELLVNQQKQLDDLNQDFNEVISDIKDIQRHELLMPKMRYYEGIEGVKRVYEDTLVEGKEIYAFENVEDMSLEVQDYLWNSYVPRRTEKGIFAHVITPKNPSNIEFKNNDKKSARKTKFIPKAKFPIEIEINIYGEKTALFSYKHEEMFGVILESKAITNSMKAIFNLCWDMASGK